MYLGVAILIAALIVVSLKNNSFRIYCSTEFYLVLGFFLNGLISIILHDGNLIDSVLVFYFRLSPLLLIWIGFRTFLRNESKIEFFSFHRITIGLLILSLIGGCYHYFIEGRIIDDLVSIQGNAHSFSFLVLYFSVVLAILNKRKRVFFGILVLISIFLVIKADFKLGIVVFAVSFFLAYFFKEDVKKALIGMFLVVIMSIVLVLNAEFIFTQLLQGTGYQFLYDVAVSPEMWDLDNYFPSQLELFKGYVQLFTRVFENEVDFLFGVGPGNYASNIAMAKNKENAIEYVIWYREILDSKNVVYGTLLNRTNSFINLIAEYGIVGTITYLAIFISLIIRIPRLLYKESNIASHLLIKRNLFVYYLTAFYLIIEFPFLGTFEEGLYMSVMCISLSSLAINFKRINFEANTPDAQ